MALHSSKYKELEVEEHDYEWSNVVFQDVSIADWQYELIDYLKEPLAKESVVLKRNALKYTLLDDCLYRRIVNGLSIQKDSQWIAIQKYIWMKL